MSNNAVHSLREIASIFSTFQCVGSFIKAVPYGSGHINNTYKITTQNDHLEFHYILQQINHHVFKDVPALMDNITKVTQHIGRKFEVGDMPETTRKVLRLIPSSTGNNWLQDGAGTYWRCYQFIENAIGIDVIETPSQAYEAAKAFGAFQCQLADLPGRLHETIPNFHHTRSRYNDLMCAIKEDPFNRAQSVQAEINFAISREAMVDCVLDRMASGEIPERVTHNDTKLNNVLLDSNTGEGVCVIDLDTVMPGSVLYDFGDMVRSSTTTAAEDEGDLSKIKMDIVYFEALVKGYLETAANFLVPKEVELLPLSGSLITFETGARFLTDYLQGDHYFKTHRPSQNLDRCRKQFKMIQSMEEQMDTMKKIVEEVAACVC